VIAVAAGMLGQRATATPASFNDTEVVSVLVKPWLDALLRFEGRPDSED